MFVIVDNNFILQLMPIIAISIMCMEDYDKMSQRPPLSHTSLNLSSLGGKVETAGEFHTEVEHKDTLRTRIVVVKGNT